MTFFYTLFNTKMSVMLVDPVFNETHLHLPDFVEDDTDTKREWEYKVYQTDVPTPDNLLHSSSWEKQNSSPYDDCPCFLWQIQQQGSNYHFNHIE